MRVVPRRSQRRARRYASAAGTTITLLAGMALIGPAASSLASARAEPDAAADQTPRSPSAAASTSAPTTAARLRALADTIQAGPGDTQTGPYNYHHIRRWILDTTGTPAPRPNTPAVFAVEIRRWSADDGSGRIVETQLGPDYQLIGADPNHRSTDAEFAAAPPVPTDYPAGNLGSPIHPPLATDPQALARQLATADPLPDGPRSTPLTIDALYASYYLSRPVRAAALRVLADVAGLTYHQAAADRLGRIGVAVSLEHRNRRYTLILDPANGQLLASQQQLIAPHAYLPVPVGLVTNYTLFIDQGRPPDLNQPPSDPGGAGDRETRADSRRPAHVGVAPRPGPRRASRWDHLLHARAVPHRRPPTIGAARRQN